MQFDLFSAWHFWEKVESIIRWCGWGLCQSGGSGYQFMQWTYITVGDITCID